MRTRRRCGCTGRVFPPTLSPVVVWWLHSALLHLRVTLSRCMCERKHVDYIARVSSSRHTCSALIFSINTSKYIEGNYKLDVCMHQFLASANWFSQPCFLSSIIKRVESLLCSAFFLCFPLCCRERCCINNTSEVKELTKELCKLRDKKTNFLWQSAFQNFNVCHSTKFRYRQLFFIHSLFLQERKLPRSIKLSKLCYRS